MRYVSVEMYMYMYACHGKSCTEVRMMGWEWKLCGETLGCRPMRDGDRTWASRYFEALSLRRSVPCIYHHEENSVAAFTGQHTRVSSKTCRVVLQQAGPACHQDTRVCGRVPIWTATP